jgi:hypothetical protein
MNALRKAHFDEVAGAGSPISGATNVPLSSKGIENLHPGLLEIPEIARGNREVMQESVYINEEGHSKDGVLMSSVVSVNSSGRNQPFSGHFKSQSTNPSFLRRFTRFSRYSPLSIRSTSNCWPGLMPSCCRISAGKTICPLLDTVVVMSGKISSYPTAVNGGATSGLVSGLKARPHPGPLPQEREDRSERLWPAADLGGGAAFARQRNNAPNATSAFELMGAARMLSLSSEERAGVWSERSSDCSRFQPYQGEQSAVPTNPPIHQSITPLLHYSNPPRICPALTKRRSPREEHQNNKQQ